VTARRRVLVVEDDGLIRESLVEALEDHGYQVTGVANGRDALDVLATLPRPDVILLDLMMPVMDGRSFRDHQLRDPALAAIPVLVLSAASDVARAGAEMRAAGVLRKPVTRRALLEELRRHGGPPP
jgi:CheY-like chemotaxis protein